MILYTFLQEDAHIADINKSAIFHFLTNMSIVYIHCGVNKPTPPVLMWMVIGWFALALFTKMLYKCNPTVLQSFNK